MKATGKAEGRTKNSSRTSGRYKPQKSTWEEIHRKAEKFTLDDGITGDFVSFVLS